MYYDNPYKIKNNKVINLYTKEIFDILIYKNKGHFCELNCEFGHILFKDGKGRVHLISMNKGN